jgi:HPt (histidine-containing phosphotransfer) domain-containing protein
MTPIADAKMLFEFTGPLSDTDLKAFLQNYLNTLQERHTKLKQLIDDGNIKEAHAIAHSVKSNSLYIAANALSEACEQLEESLEGEIDSQQVKLKWQLADGKFAEVIHYLMDYIK